ncbi:hypothetical protein PHYPSEUDO_012651 [Phytophthora pseudosyringae]|uniref:Uncharacterized protein n=1 Tax=Phytophthora pseudosyringae TaxID=221518 RepID=A0A8T1V747_9STRA|nr:hypothetical protein PHYPSEUDO_012651 [Phytophthora pseudosyringae]
MIVPTRFGLKYAPIPTLALEYEDDLKGVVDATGESSASLYVYRDGGGAKPRGPSRKLHVVELPMLTRSSETQQITRQLQQDNGRFLAPGVVSEAQLKRLLDRLVTNLPDRAPAESNEEEQRQASLTAAQQEEESELEESAMEESVMEESVADAEVSRSDELEKVPLSTTSELNPNRGAFVSQGAESDQEDEAEADVAKVEGQDEHESSHGSKTDHDLPNTSPRGMEQEERSEGEAEEDAKKAKALRSESDVSEEEVQSEELEYFSEDGSDEDSF